jgi:hypothetical protein
MPVNGVEIKEGQVWLDACGQKRTIVSNKNGSATYIWKGTLENGEWDTYTDQGAFLKYKSSYNDLVTLISEKEEKPMKFNPKPGDTIVCNNGQKFICCTKEFLEEDGLAGHMPDNHIFAYRESPNKIYNKYEWMYWKEDCTYPDSKEFDIKDVIPNLVEEPKYTIEEIVDAFGKCLYLTYPQGNQTAIDKIQDYLDKKSDPEYAKYLELKTKYEGK